MKERRSVVMRAALLCAIFAFAAAGLAVGCSTSSDDEARGPQAALKNATGVEWIVASDATTGAVTFAAPKSGPFTLPGAGEQGALVFLDAQKSVFKMHDPRTELAIERTNRNEGSTHVRFAQKVNGIPVRGATWTAHFDGAGRLTSMSGRYVVDAHATATTPSLAAETAAATAKDEAARRHPSVPAGELQASTPSLEIFTRDDGAPKLAWAVTIRRGARVLLNELVDATSGAVLLATDASRAAMATAPAPQSYPPYNVDAGPLTFPVSDDDPPALNATLDGGTNLRVVPATDFDVRIVATSVLPWSDPTTPPGAAIAAMAHAKTVFDYYAEHRWQSDERPYYGVNGNGAGITFAVNNNELGADNGTFSCDVGGAYAVVSLGDGIPDQGIYPASASLDLIAHELTHGVNVTAAGLLYDGRSQSSAIDESFADVFAALITHRIRNDDASDFTFLEDQITSGVPVRSMIRPSTGRQPGGPTFIDVLGAIPQVAATVPGHAFYLLTHGGTNERTRVKVPCGIGWGAADRLYWRLLTSHVQPNETFFDLAVHSLAAARELGIVEMPIACAWVAVGVLNEETARNDWNVTCAREDADAAAAPDASDNVLVTTPAPLVECQASLTGGGVSLGR